MELHGIVLVLINHNTLKYIMMKKKFLLLVICLIPALMFSQLPLEFKYQSVIRGADTKPLISQSLTIKVSILSDNASGTEV